MPVYDKFAIHNGRGLLDSPAMLKLYGWKRSRASRCMWVLEELGLEYEHFPLNQTNGETRTPDYLALNPAGKIPTLVDGDFVLSETQAINAYLVGKAPNALWPTDPRQRAKVQQWSLWALSEIEPLVMNVLRESRRAKEQQDSARTGAAIADIHRLIRTVLEPALKGQDYLIPGAGFTLADLNVAAVLSSLPMFGIKLDEHPATSAWFQRCYAREAWKRVQSRPGPG